MNSDRLPKNGSSDETKKKAAHRSARTRASKGAKRVHEGFQSALTTVQGSGKDAVRVLTEQLERRPLVVLGVCAGAAFLLGNLVSSRTIRLLALAAVGYGISRMPVDRLRELASQGIARLGGERERATG